MRRQLHDAAAATSAGWVVGAIVLFAVIVTMPRDTGPTSLLVLCAATPPSYGRERAALFADRAVSARAPAAAPKGRLVTLVLLAIAGHMVGKALLYWPVSLRGRPGDGVRGRYGGLEGPRVWRFSGECSGS